MQEKLKGAADLDAVLAIAKEAGFDVSKAEWLRYQAKQTIELSDEELERVAGGGCWLYSINAVISGAMFRDPKMPKGSCQSWSQ